MTRPLALIATGVLLCCCSAASPYTQAPVKDEPQCGADWDAPSQTIGQVICKVMSKGFFYAM